MRRAVPLADMSTLQSDFESEHCVTQYSCFKMKNKMNNNDFLLIISFLACHGFLECLTPARPNLPNSARATSGHRDERNTSSNQLSNLTPEGFGKNPEFQMNLSGIPAG
jgi:hypothetical protein